MPQQRNQAGRFVPGNSGGPGRPKKPRDPAYMNLLQDVVGLENWRNIIEKTIQHALYGDKDARKFLADYLLGRPGIAVAPEDVNPVPTSREKK